ncbi:MAG: ABC transporter ATP-binding protein, partial [Longimicrobiales bacterium]
FQLIPTLTALENVLVPMELARRTAFHGLLAARRRRALRARAEVSRDGGVATLEPRARELLERVGLGDRTHHYPAQLSGGEQQRVALARAFANRPRILFADEPTGNLDAATGRTVIELMVRLNAEERTTLVLVTHDPDLAARAHRTVRLAGGRIVSDSANP